jgi:hypothetical protein
MPGALGQMPAEYLREPMVCESRGRRRRRRRRRSGLTSAVYQCHGRPLGDGELQAADRGLTVRERKCRSPGMNVPTYWWLPPCRSPYGKSAAVFACLPGVGNRMAVVVAPLHAGDVRPGLLAGGYRPSTAAVTGSSVQSGTPVWSTSSPSLWITTATVTVGQHHRRSGRSAPGSALDDARDSCRSAASPLAHRADPWARAPSTHPDGWCSARVSAS